MVLPFLKQGKRTQAGVLTISVSESLKDDLESAKIYTEVFGSDHCPVELVIKKVAAVFFCAILFGD